MCMCRASAHLALVPTGEPMAEYLHAFRLKLYFILGFYIMDDEEKMLMETSFAEITGIQMNE